MEAPAGSAPGGLIGSGRLPVPVAAGNSRSPGTDPAADAVRNEANQQQVAANELLTCSIFL